MNLAKRFTLLVLFSTLQFLILAQNIVISSPNSDTLMVCNADNLHTSSAKQPCSAAYGGFAHNWAAVWDGTINGEPGPSDVYVYIVKITCGELVSKRVGDVTLLR